MTTQHARTEHARPHVSGNNDGAGARSQARGAGARSQARRDTDADGTRTQVTHLRHLLDGRWVHVRDDARDLLARLDLDLDVSLTTQQRRERISRLMHVLAHSERQRLGFLSEYGGDEDIGGAVKLLQIIGHPQVSVLVQGGVAWGVGEGGRRGAQEPLPQGPAYDETCPCMRRSESREAGR